MNQAIGIDIGGTSTKLGLVDELGRASNFRSFPTKAKGFDPQPFLLNLLQHLAQLMDSSQGEIAGIGVCTHGYIDDNRRGPIVCESTPALRGLDLSGWLREKFSLPIVINNDLVAHAMAEFQYGCGRGTHRFMTMALGTGIGVGVVVEGKPLRYVGGTSGDTGRIILDPAGPKCVYGVRGSAEALCGTAYIEALAELRYGKKVSAFEVIRAARQGADPIAVEIIQHVGGNVGWALCSLCSIFAPERVALTGGTTVAGNVLLEACQNKFEEMVGDYHRKLIELSHSYFRGVEIVLGQCGEESGVVGAVVELLQPYTENA